MAAPIVFFDIAGPAETRLSRFYRDVFDWEMGEDGNLSAPVVSPPDVPSVLLGTLRTDPAEKLLYLGVENIEETLQEIVVLGGKIDQPRFEVPGVVVLGLFFDPAGNRMGLVELENGTVKVPEIPAAQ